jgi:folate-binding protein YgfZ
MSSVPRQLHEECGATFAPFFAVELPAHYGDVAAEWKAARHDCGMIDAGWRGLLRATGSDRADFLQGMLTNQIKALTPGQGVHAAHLTVQGRVVADMRVFVLGDEIWLDLPVQRKTLLRETLERYLVADDVELADDDAFLPLLSLEGPRSREVASAVFGARFDGMMPLAHVERDGFRIANAGNCGERGLLVFGRTDGAPHLWRRCRDAGAVPVGMQALDVLRVEAGVPWCDRDMDESTLAPEVGLQDAISFTKGCYIGQEVVERVAARGQVQRRLMGVRCEGDRVPAAGSKVSRGGEEAGAITSAVHSPAPQGVIALAYIRRSAWEPGTAVEIDGTGHGQVAALPFYSSPAKR